MFWSKKKTIKCPDGTTKTVYRNIDDALPLFIQGYERDLGGKLKGIEQVEGELSGSAKSKIDGMLFDLNNFNSNIVMEFRSIYMVFESDPCSNSDFLRVKTEELISKYQNLNELKLKIYGLVEIAKTANIDGGNFMDGYFELVSDYSEVLLTESPKAKILQAQKEIQKLNQENNG